MALVTSAFAQNAINSNGYVSADANPYQGTYKYETIDGVLYVNKFEYSSASTYPYILVKFAQCKNVTTYTIPDGVFTIMKGAFQGNKYIQKIRIPSSVRYIGDNAFDGCENLSSIEVYESSSTNVNEVFEDADSEATEVGRYNIQGVKIQEGEDGQVQIILYSDGSSKKVVTK